MGSVMAGAWPTLADVSAPTQRTVETFDARVEESPKGHGEGVDLNAALKSAMDDAGLSPRQLAYRVGGICEAGGTMAEQC